MRPVSSAKHFVTDLTSQNGIITYVSKHDDIFPKFTTNKNAQNTGGVGDPHKKYRKGDTFITFDGKTGDEASLLIDFGKYKASIFSYSIRMNQSYTPPREWDVSGRNNDDEEWTIVSSPPATDYLCGIPSSGSTCTNTTVNKFYSNNDKFFRYIRFRVLEARRQTLIYYRVNRFEIYGSLVGFVSCKTFYNRCNRNAMSFMLLLELIYFSE